MRVSRIQEQKRAQTSAKRIVDDIILKVFGIYPYEVREKTRKREVMLPRQVGITLLMLAGKTSISAGRHYGKNHSTALHAKKAINNFLETQYPRHIYMDIRTAIVMLAVRIPSVDLSELPKGWADDK